MQLKLAVCFLLLLAGVEVARSQSGSSSGSNSGSNSGSSSGSSNTGSSSGFLTSSGGNSGSSSGGSSGSSSSSGYGNQCYCYSLKDYLNSEYYDQAKLVLRIEVVAVETISPSGYDYERNVTIAKVSHIWQTPYYSQNYQGSNSQYSAVNCGDIIAIVVVPSDSCAKNPPFQPYYSYIITVYDDFHYDYQYPTLYYNPCYDTWSLFCTAWSDSGIVSQLQAWSSTPCPPCSEYSYYYSNSYLSSGSSSSSSSSSSSGGSAYSSSSYGGQSSSSSSSSYACAYCNTNYRQFISYDDAYCAGYYVETGNYEFCPNYQSVQYSSSGYNQQEYYPQQSTAYNSYYSDVQNNYKEY